MEDSKIIELYWKRNEDAIRQTEKKYGRYCHSIAYNILFSNQDAEECVNDTYVRAWESIPPTRPNRFSAFIGRIIRNIALDRYDVAKAKKRDGGILEPLDELSECIPDPQSENVSTDTQLADAINGFLAGLSKRKRIIFMQRYWYCCPIKDIALRLRMSEINVKVTLMRTRNEFREYLTGKGINI